MLILNVTREELERALEAANLQFEGNLEFTKLEQAERGWRVRLGVKGYDGPGYRRSTSGRRMRHACWHAHGVFFDCLPPQAVIRAGRFTIHPGDPWLDWNIGSQIVPLYLSEACDCSPYWPVDYPGKEWRRL